MADVVTSKTIFDGPRRLVMLFTSLSDGTGESAVTKIDKSTFTGLNGAEPSSFKIVRVDFDVAGMQVQIYADHTSPLTLLRLANGTNHFKFDQPLSTASAGGTGDILFTTSGQAANSAYTIKIELLKVD